MTMMLTMRFFESSMKFLIFVSKFVQRWVRLKLVQHLMGQTDHFSSPRLEAEPGVCWSSLQLRGVPYISSEVHKSDFIPNTIETSDKQFPTGTCVWEQGDRFVRQGVWRIRRSSTRPGRVRTSPVRHRNTLPLCTASEFRHLIIISVSNCRCNWQ